MALHGYLVDEIAHDFGDGVLTRREALRRLAMLGLSVTGASAVLAACAKSDSDKKASTASTVTSTASGGPPGKATARKAEAVTFAGTAGQLKGAFAAAPSPKAAVLVVHENRGLTPHFFDVPGRLAGVGYTALVVDLLSRKGSTAAVGDEAAAQAALGAAPVADLLADLRSGIDELEKRVPGKKLGAVGFCFGGGMVWNLLNTGESRLAAAAPFYGPCPENPDFSKAKAAVLAIYGADDTFVNPTRDRAVAALEKAKLVHEVKTFTAPAMPSSTTPASATTPPQPPAHGPRCSAGSARIWGSLSAALRGAAGPRKGQSPLAEVRSTSIWPTSFSARGCGHRAYGKEASCLPATSRTTRASSI